MARHRVQAEPTTGVRPRSDRFEVRPFEVDGAARFVVVGEDDDRWLGQKWYDTNLTGAFVMLEPGPGVTDAEVDVMRKEMYAARVALVHVRPRLAAKVVPNAVSAPAARRTIREHANELLDESNSTDKAALKKLVDETLSKRRL
jgi:hypothetical protein